MSTASYQYQSLKLKQIKGTLQNILDNFEEHPEQIAEMMAFKAQFYNYSMNNTALIYRQNQGATYVASYKDWNKKGYHIRKGQHGMKVLFPMRTELIEIGVNNGKKQYRRVTDATPEEKKQIALGELKPITFTRFGIGTVFDIAQTDCPPEKYPEFFHMGYSSEQHATLYEAVKNYAKQKGIPVNESDLQSISLRGYFNTENGEIRISDKLNDTERLSTLTHELGHALMHSNPKARQIPKATRELEADCISIMLQNYCGLKLTDSRKRHFVQNYEACKGIKNFKIEDVLKDVNFAYFNLHKELEPIFDRVVSNKEPELKNFSASYPAPARKEVHLEDLAVGQKYYDKDLDDSWHDDEIRTAYKAVDESRAYGGTLEYGPPMSDREIKDMFDRINDHRETVKISRIYQEDGKTIIDTLEYGEISAKEFLERINNGKAILEPENPEVPISTKPQQPGHKPPVLEPQKEATVQNNNKAADSGNKQSFLEALLNGNADITDYEKYDIPAEELAAYPSEEFIAYQDSLGMNDQEFRAWICSKSDDKALLLRNICFCRVNGVDFNFVEYMQRQEPGESIRIQQSSSDKDIRPTVSKQPPHDYKEQDAAVLDHIKYGVSILTLASDMGFTPKQIGNYYTLKEHDSVRIYPETNSFMQFSSGVGGSTIDFVMNFGGYNKQDAIRMLKERYAGNMIDPLPSVPKPQKKTRPTPERKTFELPERINGKFSHTYAYLTKTRCLDPEIVQQCFKDGLVYEDVKHNAVFIGKDETGLPAFATRRSTLTKSHFKCDVAGGRQDIGFFVNNNAEKLYVCEAPIDALSIMSLMKQQGKPVEHASYLATCGTGKDSALYTRLRNNPQIREVVLANDRDTPGWKANKKMIEKLSKEFPQVKVSKLSPKQGKDINEYLCNRATSPKLQARGMEVAR